MAGAGVLVLGLVPGGVKPSLARKTDLNIDINGNHAISIIHMMRLAF
jgi:hypothetical protein